MDKELQGLFDKSDLELKSPTDNIENIDQNESGESDADADESDKTSDDKNGINPERQEWIKDDPEDGGYGDTIELGLTGSSLVAADVAEIRAELIQAREAFMEGHEGRAALLVEECIEDLGEVVAEVDG